MRLLLIEDDEILGEGLRDYLSADEHRVDWCRSLREVAAYRGEPYDALLVDLAAREWAILEALLLRAGRIVPKPDLERLVLGFDAEWASNAVEVHVAGLRRKLGREVVETIRGLGYRIGAQP